MSVAIASLTAGDLQFLRLALEVDRPAVQTRVRLDRGADSWGCVRQAAGYRLEA